MAMTNISSRGGLNNIGKLRMLKTSLVIFTCSNSTVETLEKGVKYVQSKQ